MPSRAKNIYTIPAGAPFARVLAKALVDETAGKPETLSRYLIILPTRRAGRVLREAFLDVKNQTALLLPQMQAVGDMDEEELSLTMQGEDAARFPPAMPNIQREIILSKLVMARQAMPQEQALKLARALGQLLDQIHTENLDMGALENLVPDDLSEHWQKVIDFLEIIRTEWPNILKAHGYIDAADRRNRLILARADHWEKSPPNHPVIAAGSTGSIPATARLLKVVSNMPQGRVILPGLDTELDTESWDALEETHPQYGFKELFERMDIPREHVQTFGGENAALHGRYHLAREIMRPAQTVYKWANLPGSNIAKSIKTDAFQGLSLLEADHEREEAEAIALLLRETLETPDKTACLITPDRNLAERVSHMCKRWSVQIDDSAGRPLTHSRIGNLLTLIMNVVQTDVSATALLALLKHPSVRCDNNHIQALDAALRGPKGPSGFDGIIQTLESQDTHDDNIIRTIQNLKDAFEPLLNQAKTRHSFKDILKAHLTVMESITDENALWAGDEGRSAAQFINDIFAHAGEIEPLNHTDYIATLTHFMDQVTIRPSYGTHPRLQILGQLEARLIDADLVIMAALNAGTWPPDPGADPWMSRPMRKDFGLPSMERGIGLAAHDFVQGFCAPQIIMSRSRKKDGTPTVPCRWLQRLQAVTRALDIQIPHAKNATGWVKALDSTDDIKPAQRPAPCPPLDVRPQKLPVTQIETWMKDPYAVYARYILNLRPMDELDQPLDARILGTLLHDILEKFSHKYKETKDKPVYELLISIAEAKIKKRHEPPSSWNFWWPKFSNIARWLDKHETAWQEDHTTLATEVFGSMQVQTETGAPFIIYGIADRIDKDTAGNAVIIDYKSGGTFSAKNIQSGESPQLPLEALILKEGGFKNVPATDTESLQYWVLNNNPAVKGLHKDIEETLETTKTGLKSLIQAYQNPDMPYLCLPRADNLPRFNDYEHFARVKEWAVSGDDDMEDAA